VAKYILLLSCVLILASCVGPEDLGFSEQQWDKLSPDKQQQIFEQHQALLDAKHDETPAPINDTWIKVTIKDGTVMMPPDFKAYQYQPVTFKIQDGVCKKVELDSHKNTYAVNLDVCYKNQVLLIDPSRYEIDKRDASIRLYASPLWQNGFTYNNVNSSGYARLKNASITVKQVS
jgi:hypothetical protein